MNRDRMPSIEVCAVGAKGRDFDLEAVFQHHDDAKVCPDRIGALKGSLHLLGRRIGRDVEIFGRLAAQEVAHAAAREVSNMAGGT